MLTHIPVFSHLFTWLCLCEHTLQGGHFDIRLCNFCQLSAIMVYHSAGRYTGSYRIPVFISLTIWIFKIPQYRCHLNNVWNAALLERGLFSLLHFGEDTAVCVTKRESSETEALVECDEREEVIHNIHIDRHKYPPSAASAPASLTN